MSLTRFVSGLRIHLDFRLVHFVYQDLIRSCVQELEEALVSSDQVCLLELADVSMASPQHCLLELDEVSLSHQACALEEEEVLSSKSCCCCLHRTRIQAGENTSVFGNTREK